MTAELATHVRRRHADPAADAFAKQLVAWIPHGQRQEVMTPGKNRRRTIFGAVDLAFGRFFYR